MSDFRVVDAVDNTTIRPDTATKPRAHREIKHVIEVNSSTEMPFSYHSGIHIRIDSERHVRTTCDTTHDIDTGPAGLWCGDQSPEASTIPAEIDRPEGSNADRRDGLSARHVVDRGSDRFERRNRLRGWKTFSCVEDFTVSAGRHNNLRTTEFDSDQQSGTIRWHRFRP
jgi:hypothetical protein